MLDDRIEIVQARLPAQNLTNPAGAGHQRGRIARAPVDLRTITVQIGDRLKGVFVAP